MICKKQNQVLVISKIQLESKNPNISSVVMAHRLKDNQNNAFNS